jgi:hypothetical protein
MPTTVATLRRGEPRVQRAGRRLSEITHPCVGVARRNGRSRASEPNGFFRAGVDAEAATVTGRGAHHEGLATAMRESLELADERERSALRWREDAELEHVVGANANAVFFAFTTISVDDRRQ